MQIRFSEDQSPPTFPWNNPPSSSLSSILKLPSKLASRLRPTCWQERIGLFDENRQSASHNGKYETPPVNLLRSNRGALCVLPSSESAAAEKSPADRFYRDDYSQCGRPKPRSLSPRPSRSWLC